MAQKTELNQLIAKALRYDHAMIDELIEVVEEWDEIDDSERLSWMMDWDQFALSEQRDLRRWYTNGDMSVKQEAEYERLLERIDEHIPLIQQYGLTVPRIPVES
jgi:hypothetical protein